MSNREDLLEIVRTVMNSVPFNAHLGLEVLEVKEGFARLRLPFRPEFVGDPTRPALHGGVLSAMLDTVGGAAAWSMVTLSERISTIDLRVDYLLPARLETVIAEGRVIRHGRRLSVVTMRAYHESNPAQTVTDGRGVYNIRSAPKLPI